MKCGAFDPEKGRDFHKGLAEYHKECLKRLHVPMGTDGYNVLELSHKEGYLLDILIGELWVLLLMALLSRSGDMFDAPSE